MDASAYRTSYRKTIGLAAVALVVAAIGAIGLVQGEVSILRWVLSGIAALLAAFAAAVVAGGLFCLRREANQERGIGWMPRPNVRNRSARESAVRRAIRVGDRVEVRSAEEIMATLDAAGTLEALPFMPEMLAYCGKRFSVSNRADKILDMIDKTGLRRMRRAAFLDDVRCDGSAHDGCQQGCRIIWKTSWLRRVQPGSPEPEPGADTTAFGAQLQPFVRRSDSEDREEPLYRCQATELLAASTRMHHWDPRAELRALATGNVRLGDFVLVLSMRAFNFVQELRGGSRYPAYTPSCRGKTPQERLDLYPGEWVEVKSLREIEATLGAEGRNRGMRFDREMVRYCGGRYRVRSRVDRLIDEKTGRMLVLRNPCIVLEGVETPGEFLRFNPQREFPYWREIWLRRVSERSN